MTWNEEKDGKWIDIVLCKQHNFNYRVVNKCVLIGIDEQSQINGFTVFKPSSIAQFINEKRITERIKKSNIISFLCVIPPDYDSRCTPIIEGVKKISIEKTLSPFVVMTLRYGKMTLRSKVRIVNVDDSSVILKMLGKCLERFPWIDIVAQISEPKMAVDSILSIDPDVITLDIQMPVVNGVTIVQRLLPLKYFPVIMVSSLSLTEGSLVLDALYAGAFDYLQKPELTERESFERDLSDRIITALQGKKVNPISRKSTTSIFNRGIRLSDQNDLIWAFGASTGGTQALTSVFTSLPAEIPPTLVVQHIPPVFSKAFAESVNALCPFMVKEAVSGDILAKNTVYIAPGGKQMSVEKNGSALTIRLSDDPPVNRFRPSIDYLFYSLCELDTFQCVAGLFTGMGKDGAQGLLKLKKHGAKTFAQDEQSSAVYGMPRVAAEMGAADKIASLQDIPELILELSVHPGLAKVS